MATLTNRKFSRKADKNMSVLFGLFLILIRIHHGSTDNDAIHIQSFSDPENLLPEDSYFGLNHSENSRTTHGASPAKADGGHTGEATPSSVERSGDVAVTVLGHLLMTDVLTTAFTPSLTTECLKVLTAYADYSADFVFCALISSKPLLFCESCVDEFVKVVRKFEEIKNMTRCGDQLLSSDRVQLLRETHGFVNRIWNKGNCADCFQNMDSCESNATTKCHVKKDVIRFQSLINQTLDCFSNSATADDNVCQNCSALYKKLSDFYVELGTVDEVCIDCVEQMNNTRKEWSVVHNCTYSRKDVVSIVAISVFLCSMPLFFYATSKIHTAKSEHKLMKLSRLKRLSQSFRVRLPGLPAIHESYITEDSSSERM